MRKACHAVAFIAVAGFAMFVAMGFGSWYDKPAHGVTESYVTPPPPARPMY